MAHRQKPRLPFDADARIPAITLILIACGAFILGWPLLYIPALAAAGYVLFFFRDPTRPIPNIPGAVVSPADGKVVRIRTNMDPEAGPVGGPCITIFLSVLNVHINRAPFAGKVEAIRYKPGEFLNALDDESNDRNECNWVHMQSGRYQMTVRQIAGLIARRIVCRVHEGQELKRGQRIGLIRFGSRTELYLPPEARLQVEVGQTVQGGRSILAYLPED
jgi:phosphatidylserine decarboxylase